MGRKPREPKLIKRKKIQTDGIIPYEMMCPRTAREISSYLSPFVSGMCPSMVKRLWESGELACGCTNKNSSNYYYADKFLESLMRKEDAQKEKLQELEKKHGRL